PGGNIISFRDEKLFTPSEDPAVIQTMLEAFYRRHARRIISSKLEKYTSFFGIDIKSISINGARRRFGSCSSNGELNFSWRLAMYPEELIELVVLHELAHRREMNHSGEFYKVLASFLPDHRERNKRLTLWSRKLSNYP
ncbi:MAG: M48 family metallopeptidase, partial [Lentisphaeria bacterium]|nr:M48 family metallopeptidase [Lentisphaeria bacterium]